MKKNNPPPSPALKAGKFRNLILIGDVRSSGIDIIAVASGCYTFSGFVHHCAAGIQSYMSLHVLRTEWINM
jgi:hypothetical protein